MKRRLLLLLPFVLCLVIGTVGEVRSRTDTMTPLEYATAFCAENAVFQAADGSLWQYAWKETDDLGRDCLRLDKIGPLTVPDADNVNDNLKLTITGLSRIDDIAPGNTENTYILQYSLQKYSPRLAMAYVRLQTYMDGGWYQALLYPSCGGGEIISLLAGSGVEEENPQPLPGGHYRLFAERDFRGRYDIAESKEFDLVHEDGCYRLFIDGEELS